MTGYISCNQNQENYSIHVTLNSHSNHQTQLSNALWSDPKQQSIRTYGTWGLELSGEPSIET